MAVLSLQLHISSLFIVSLDAMGKSGMQHGDKFKCKQQRTTAKCEGREPEILQPLSVSLLLDAIKPFLFW